MHVFEECLRVAYSGGWPARLWGLVPGATAVRLIEHELKRGREGRPPLRIAFASDLHLGPTTPPRLLDNAFALIRNAQPDVLALGGDYVYLGSTPARVRELNDRVAGVPAPVKVAVLGNHDFWARPARLETALIAAGTVVLVDETLRLAPPHDDVALIGLDDPFTGRGRRDAHVDEGRLPDALRQAASARIRIALCHSPDGLTSIRGHRIDLLLCGHTHGGHLALPGHRPLVMPSPMGRIYPWGLHDVDGTRLFVSRGVGGSFVPVRTWAPPDVAVFTIT
jgi:uncharacterized protein